MVLREVSDCLICKVLSRRITFSMADISSVSQLVPFGIVQQRHGRDFDIRGLLERLHPCREFWISFYVQTAARRNRVETLRMRTSIFAIMLLQRSK